MSKVWNSAYENDIDDSTAGNLIDDNIRTLKAEIRKRLETFFDNWADDPDTPTTLDVKDDAILAEHISGLTGTGSVSTDNIPEGSTNLYLNGIGTLDDLADGSTYKRVLNQVKMGTITVDTTSSTSYPVNLGWQPKFIILYAGFYNQNVNDISSKGFDDGTTHYSFYAFQYNGYINHEININYSIYLSSATVMQGYASFNSTGFTLTVTSSNSSWGECKILYIAYA